MMLSTSFIQSETCFFLRRLVCALAFRGNRFDRTKNVPKNVSNDDEGSASGNGSGDNERLGGWDPPTAAGVGNGKLLLTRGDNVSSNVGRKAEIAVLSSSLEP